MRSPSLAMAPETDVCRLLKNAHLLRFPHPSPFNVPKVRLTAQDIGGLASGHF
jgi:hypothetical protein